MMLATSVYDAVEWQAATNWVGTITDASLKLKVIDASLPPVRPWNNAATPAPFSFIAPAPPVVAPIAPPVVPAAPRVAPPPPPQPFPRRFKHAHVHGGVQPKPHHHLHHHHHHPHRHHHSSRGPSRGPHSPPWPRRHKRAHLHDDLDLDLERGHDHSRERDFRPRRRWDAPLRSVSPPNRDDEPGSATAGNRRGYRVPSPSDSPVPRFLDELTDDDERHPIFPRTRPPLQPVVDLEASTRSHIFGNPMPVQRTSAHHSSTDLFPIQLPEISAPFPPMPGAFEFSTPAASTAQPVPVCESPALSARSPADGSTAAAVPAADPPCCNVDASRREIKGMMSDFLRNFSSVMGDSFATDIPPPPSPFIMPAVTVTTPASSSRSPMGMHIRSPVPAPAADVLPLHRNVWCDACGSSIRGTRYQCSVCPNYDLCGRCLGLGNIHPASHSFTSIEAPLPTPPATTPAPAPPTTHSELEYIIGRDIPVEAVDPNEPPSIHTSVYCDCCSEVIIGERSKCVDCNDYDLCSQCIVRMRDIHNPEHRFFTLVKPNRIVVHTVDDIFNPPARSPIVPAAPPVPAAPSIAEQDAADRELRDVSDYMSACSIMVRQIMEEAMSNITQTGVDRLAEQLTETAAGAEARINSVSEGVRGALGAARNVHAELEAAAATAREARDSLRTPAQRADALPVEHAATCNLCDSQVYGTRWKCLDCPDWDSCNACFAIVGEQHPSHRFVRVETKTSSRARPALRVLSTTQLATATRRRAMRVTTPFTVCATSACMRPALTSTSAPTARRCPSVCTPTRIRSSSSRAQRCRSPSPPAPQRRIGSRCARSVLATTRHATRVSSRSSERATSALRRAARTLICAPSARAARAPSASSLTRRATRCSRCPFRVARFPSARHPRL
ncbi:hypothetical protein BKA62DRAFT_429081 [Auriculariales sp. MPI-PUGE-AT-0066]|nr:hypothetical protein BKA62DRAFT_429081 [Auriculariales sp. MPI-PUGE-AT-0066]